MAIGTRNRRAACIGLCLPVPSVFPNPDGSLDFVYDRMQMAYLYPVAIPSVTAGPTVIPRRVRPGRSVSENARAFRDLNAILAELDDWRSQTNNRLSDLE